MTPLKGWHKIVFDQGGLSSHPVFVSVGIDPPTVEFPRNGAELDCAKRDSRPRRRRSERSLHRGPARAVARIRGDRARRARRREISDRASFPPAQPGAPSAVRGLLRPGAGAHVLLFFQAPRLPQGTPSVVDAHLRAFSSLADTPTSRIVINARRPASRSRRAWRGSSGAVASPPAPPPTSPVPGAGNAPFNITDCPSANPLCALPFADVNVRLGERLFTVRASATAPGR